MAQQPQGSCRSQYRETQGVTETPLGWTDLAAFTLSLQHQTAQLAAD